MNSHLFMSSVVALTVAAWLNPAHARVSCNLHSQNQWADGYRVEYVVTNTGDSAIDSWSVNLNFADDPRIIEAWGASVSGTPLVNARNLTWNGFLPPGQTASFGMRGSHSGNFIVPDCVDASAPISAVPPLDATPIESISSNFGFDWPAVPGAVKYQVQESVLDENGEPTTWTTVFETVNNSAGFGFHALGRFGYRVNQCNAADQCSDFSAVKKVAVYRIGFVDSNIATGDYTVQWEAGNPDSELLENGVPIAGPGASGSITLTNKPSGVFTYSLSGLQLSTSIEINRVAADIDVDRSLFVHDEATLDAADFSLASVMNQLASQLTAGNPADPITGVDLFARMWDAQNPADQSAGTGVTPCGPTLNGFPVECRPDPEEGKQALDPALFLGQYRAIGLVNRLDLLNRADLSDCGEYRMVYGLQNAGGRNFIIFEAVVPNPVPGDASGCAPIVNLWHSLSSESDAAVRAARLRDFYFNGIPASNVRPVVDIRNYQEGTGQIRTNQFIAFSSWNLKEYKVANDNGLNTFKLVTVKSNPFGELFNAQNSDPRAAAFQNDFVVRLQSLLGNDLSFISLSMGSDAHNNGQSHSSGGDATENDFLLHFNNGSLGSGFEQAISSRLAQFNSTLTVTQVINRATAMTCGGCHLPSGFGLTAPDAIGPGQSWPDSGFFVHVQENPIDGVFRLSPALTDVFLPSRRDVMETFLFTEQLENTPAPSPAPEPELIPADENADKRSG